MGPNPLRLEDEEGWERISRRVLSLLRYKIPENDPDKIEVDETGKKWVALETIRDWGVNMDEEQLTLLCDGAGSRRGKKRFGGGKCSTSGRPMIRLIQEEATNRSKGKGKKRGKYGY